MKGAVRPLRTSYFLPFLLAALPPPLGFLAPPLLPGPLSGIGETPFGRTRRPWCIVGRGPSRRVVAARLRRCAAPQDGRWTRCRRATSAPAPRDRMARAHRARARAPRPGDPCADSTREWVGRIDQRARDRGGNGPAVLATFDHDQHEQAGLVGWREADEPGVRVGVLVLGRPGLGRDREFFVSER